MWSSIDKEKMRISQEAHMMDGGYLYAYSRDINSFGEPIETWAEGEYTICGLDFSQGTENPSDDLTREIYDATLRIPYNFDIDEKDKFKVTAYRGEAVELLFEVVTPLWKGMSGNRVGLRKAEI